MLFFTSIDTQAQTTTAMRGAVDNILTARGNDPNKIRASDMKTIMLLTADAIDASTANSVPYSFQDVPAFTGNTITLTIVIPANLRRLHIKRTGIEIYPIKDFTIAVNTLQLVLAAKDESFTIETY
ncbi:MAG: hypothetical protein ACRCXK_10535 [Wohlfahrtiimonas sp.]